VAGWRYRGREPEGSVVELVETVAGRDVFGAYGLGGAGVTLSWGIAARLMTRIGAVVGDNYDLLIEGFGKHLLRVVQGRLTE
ncbi:MAG TPA: hypothetical protein VKU40_03520, partial [Thermoanaerobaculia bacterium]|nr:hypothetical protein [Thermoanaerobaculia bacterium]